MRPIFTFFVIPIVVVLYFLAIFVIDFVYANMNTIEFEKTVEVFCPIVTIPDDFEPDALFFLVYHDHPVIQLSFIEREIYLVCLDLKGESQ